MDKVRNVRVSRVEQSLMNAIAAADFPKSRKVTAPRAGYFTSSGHFDVVKHVYFVNVSCLCMSTSKSYIEYQVWGMSGVCL